MLYLTSPPPIQALTQPAESKVGRVHPLSFEHRPEEEEMPGTTQLQRRQFPGPAYATPVRLFSGSGVEVKGKCRWQ